MAGTVAPGAGPGDKPPPLSPPASFGSQTHSWRISGSPQRPTVAQRSGPLVSGARDSYFLMRTSLQVTCCGRLTAPPARIKEHVAAPVLSPDSLKRLSAVDSVIVIAELRTTSHTLGSCCSLPKPGY